MVRRARRAGREGVLVRCEELSYATLSRAGEVLFWIGPASWHDRVLSQPELALEVGVHLHLTPSDADELAGWLQDTAVRAREKAAPHG